MMILHVFSVNLFQAHLMSILLLTVLRTVMDKLEKVSTIMQILLHSHVEINQRLLVPYMLIIPLSSASNAIVEILRSLLVFKTQIKIFIVFIKVSTWKDAISIIRGLSRMSKSMDINSDVHNVTTLTMMQNKAE